MAANSLATWLRFVFSCKLMKNVIDFLVSSTNNLPLCWQCSNGFPGLLRHLHSFLFSLVISLDNLIFSFCYGLSSFVLVCLVFSFICPLKSDQVFTSCMLCFRTWGQYPFYGQIVLLVPFWSFLTSGTVCTCTLVTDSSKKCQLFLNPFFLRLASQISVSVLRV